eukprot:scaffold454_cov333-Prasinococcus_capsulatus_cf.AAC.1
MLLRKRPAPQAPHTPPPAREGTAETARKRPRRGEGAQEELQREVVDLLRESSYQVELRALAKRLRRAPSTVWHCLNAAGMAEHLAAWRRARPTADSGNVTAWTEARKARLVQLLTDAEYDISQVDLAEALGVNQASVSKRMRQPSMAEHYAAWRRAGSRTDSGRVTVWTEARKARLVQLLRDAEYDISCVDLAAALGVSDDTVSKQMQQPSMAEHLAAWRRARPTTDSGRVTVWTEARKARLVRLLRDADYDISCKDLAAALGVSDVTLSRQMRQPSMAEHLAAWRRARPTADSGQVTVWTEARKARLVQLLRDAEYDISCKDLAAALGVGSVAVFEQLRQPSMAEHLAAWRNTRPTCGRRPTVWTEARKARLVQLLRDAEYDISQKDLAAALGVSDVTLSDQMRQPSMAEHLAAWRRARPKTDSGYATVWTEARKARLVQLLTDAEYDISQVDLAEALGVHQSTVSTQMRQPSMAEHYAAWRRARPTNGSGGSTVWTEARKARLVQLLRDAEYDISCKDLAAALGVSDGIVSRQMRQPSMAEHLAAWRGGVTVWTEARKARLVQLLRDAQYDISQADLAAALGVGAVTVSQQLRQPSMAEHLAAWRNTRLTRGRPTVWTEARKARLVQLLRDAGYDISCKDLAAALGVSPMTVFRQMRRPSMAEHDAAWRAARGRIVGSGMVDAAPEEPDPDAQA